MIDIRATYLSPLFLYTSIKKLENKVFSKKILFTIKTKVIMWTFMWKRCNYYLKT